MTFDAPSPNVIRSSDGFTVTVIPDGRSATLDYQRGDFRLLIDAEWLLGEPILSLDRTSIHDLNSVTSDDPRIDAVLEDIRQAFASQAHRIEALDRRRVYPLPFPDV